MTNAIRVVVLAAVQSVAKVFVIGLVGYCAVLFPREKPLLQRSIVGSVARFTFHSVTLPLIYSTIAITVTIDSIGDYWFVVASCFFVLGLSYLVATFLHWCIPLSDYQDFRALRISATFPNIVALPILIFPALCEFPAVHEGYALTIHPDDGEEKNTQELEKLCVENANSMIFCYFFIYMFLFWGFGYPQLIHAAKKRSSSFNKELTSTTELRIDQEEGQTTNERIRDRDEESIQSQQNDEDLLQVEENSETSGLLYNLRNAIKQTISSPGFIATLLGFITACIPPFQRALFESEAPLRFLGSAVETLGTASSSISTMIVAASLVPPTQDPTLKKDEESNEETKSDTESSELYRRNRKSRSSRLKSFRKSVTSKSLKLFRDFPRSNPEMRRLHIWFCLSRLVLAPAVIVGVIVAMDCGSDLLLDVPNLAKLVIIINSCLPGALIVVVLLKSQPALGETAAVVAKAYFLCYLLSIFTIAAWTAVGLWITLPDEDGNTICHRQ